MGAFLACLALGGLVGGGAYLLSRDGDPDGPEVGVPIWPGSQPGIAGGSDGSSPVDKGAGEERSHTPDGSRDTSELIPGRYVQAGSFRSPEGAQREVDRLQGRRIDTFSIPAAWGDELLPGFQVLLAGPISGGSEERRVLRELKQAGVSGWGRDLTPSTVLPGPTAAAGNWSGAFEQSHLRGSRRPVEYRIDLAIAADGESGTVEYPGRGCHGSLTLIEDTGYSLAYRESIESGRCPPGGVWHLRPQGAEITAVRLHDDLDLHIMVKGTVPAR